MSGTENNGPPKAKASMPSPSDESWLEHAQKEMQNEPARMEDAAKFLVAIISISLTLFLTKRPEDIGESTKYWFGLAYLLWMFSAFFSFLVLFPYRYSFNPDSPQEIKDAYRNITGTKRTILIMSLSCFLLALIVACCASLQGVQ